MTPDPADLANLRPLALADPISLWPLPLGWWILAAGVLALALLGTAWLFLRYRANAYRRAAAWELRRLAAADPSDLAPKLAELLKRTALVAYPRIAVAGLTGPAWTAFLMQTGDFPSPAAASLVQAVLDPSRPLDPPQAVMLQAAARHWIRRHRAGASLP